MKTAAKAKSSRISARSNVASKITGRPPCVVRAGKNTAHDDIQPTKATP